MVLAPFNYFVQHRLIDLCSHSQRLHHSEVCSGRCTLGIGIASLMASSPISSIMFLIRIDRSATSRSAVPQSLETLSSYGRRALKYAPTLISALSELCSLMMVVEEDILLMSLELIGNSEVILRVNASRTTVARRDRGPTITIMSSLLLAVCWTKLGMEVEHERKKPGGWSSGAFVDVGGARWDVNMDVTVSI